MDYKTFNQWSLNGYKIKRGSKAIWISNVPMFSNEQVELYAKPVSGNHWKGCTPKGTSPIWGEDYDDEEDRAQYDAWMGGYF